MKEKKKRDETVQSSLDYYFRMISLSVSMVTTSFIADINGRNEHGKSYICLVLILYTPIDVRQNEEYQTKPK